MSHCTLNTFFDREFELPCCCPEDGDLECRLLRSKCEIVHIHHDLLTFKVILVFRFVIRHGGRRCCFERAVVIHDCCWLDGRWVVDCKVADVIARCRFRHDRVRVSGVAEVRFGVRGGCHCDCCDDADWETDEIEEEWHERPRVIHKKRSFGHKPRHCCGVG